MPPSDETMRAAQLERALTHFFADGDGGALASRFTYCHSRFAPYTFWGYFRCEWNPRDELFLEWLGGAGMEALVFHQSPRGDLYPLQLRNV